MIRKAYVAGQFYSANSTKLISEIDACFLSKLGPNKHFKEITPLNTFSLKGGVSPHAGYMYSGHKAAFLYQRLYELGLPDTIIIIGPAHRMASTSKIGVFSGDGFETPLGICEIDKELAKTIALNEPFTFDDKLHLFEHSLEVQIPFLQYMYQHVNKPLKIVPICMLDQSYEISQSASETLSKILKNYNKKFAIIASSDFSHYLPENEAKKYDFLAIDAILNLNTKGMYEQIYKYDISMCGYGPIALCIDTLNKIYKLTPKLLSYGSSGDVHKMPEVVGYAAISFEINE